MLLQMEATLRRGLLSPRARRSVRAGASRWQGNLHQGRDPSDPHRARRGGSRFSGNGGAFLDHGLVDEQAHSLGKAVGAFGGEEL